MPCCVAGLSDDATHPRGEQGRNTAQPLWVISHSENFLEVRACPELGTQSRGRPEAIRSTQVGMTGIEPICASVKEKGSKLGVKVQISITSVRLPTY